MIEAQDWKLKYRPKTLDEVVLSKKIRCKLLAFKEGTITQNMLFHGSYGIGKTSCSLLLRDEIDTYNLNCSLISIDDIRKIESVGSSLTLSGNRRLIILDEVEKLSKEAFMVLRGVIEKISVFNDFVLTANDLSNIDPAILSRVECINFNYEFNQDIRAQLQTRIYQILKIEGIDLKDEYMIDIDYLIKNYYQDIRTLMGKLQGLVFDWSLH